VKTTNFTLQPVVKAQGESSGVVLLFLSPLGECKKIPSLPGLDSRTVQPIASRFTDWAVPTLEYRGKICKFLSRIGACTNSLPSARSICMCVCFFYMSFTYKCSVIRLCYIVDLFKHVCLMALVRYALSHVPFSRLVKQFDVNHPSLQSQIVFFGFHYLLQAVVRNFAFRDLNT
jgi:hypothetical protein